MLSQAKLNIFVRVIKRKIENGESLENILASYTALTEEEKEQIREAVNG